jgi:hypothetical protein
MTKAVLEAGSESAARRTTAAIPSPTLAVPASLQASLMARLDRLGPDKEVAQIGAAIGREFSNALLDPSITVLFPILVLVLSELACKLGDTARVRSGRPIGAASLENGSKS